MFIITKQYVINGRKYDISLERMIWLFLLDMCVGQRCEMETLLQRIDVARQDEKLSVAIRMCALLYAQEKYHFDIRGFQSFLEKMTVSSD